MFGSLFSGDFSTRVVIFWGFGVAEMLGMVETMIIPKLIRFIGQTGFWLGLFW